MPDPSTTRLALYKSKSDGSEDVDYSLDLGQNWDRVDAAVGAFACTSSTRPSIPWNGQLIRETDTNRVWVSNGTAPASGSWREVATPGTLQTFTAGIALTNASATGVTIATAVTGDAQRRFGVQADGKLSWGTGAGAEDTNLYRSAVNTLKTDDNLIVALNATVTGDLSVGGVGNVTLLRKAADTPRATATKTDDPDLTTTVTAGRVYLLEATLFLLTTDETNADFASTLTVPASCAGYVNYSGQATSASSAAGNALIVTSQLSAPGTQTYGALLSATYAAGTAVALSGIIRPTVTGTFAVNWARSGASGTVTLKADSYMKLTRLA
ncbi:hypothetical protein OG900_33365 [Streptomyces sp. NBC_00433]